MGRWIKENFPKPHQYVTVAAGEEKTVYEFYIPSGHRGFIESIGSNYFTNCHFHWLVDNVDMEGKIERQMASVASPIVYDSKSLIPFKNSIIVKGYNGDDVTHILEWMINGYVCHWSEVE